ncbi:hypothetical protein CAPTEDRAFT_151154 [Capitella teleta]|uniref:Poly A polymerase head domain-containing protein n=1 Tax=Capitella teleta TaxID=283909 RepID=R7UYX6_CAPTE|nr:hypothetical protein CAPTEDRAFT_151154 [Capitella teleta]|eukprot:ELU08601.1 hypothetical protein CAPTEDRAFT_151154 [Capitella teleta]
MFKKHNFELRIAGGAVRDLLLAKVPHDVDFATTATPQEMKTMFESEGIRMINMNGEKHGTITCRIHDAENFEVTTLRRDVVTDGRHAEVEFTSDWAVDAERRDLTINSMFLGFDGTIYDFFNGNEDLQKQRICFVGDANKRIQEDFLRILRYFRFYGRVVQHPGQHERETLNAIQRNVHGLADISGERIWVEVKKILVGRHAAHLVRLMMELGLYPHIGFPANSDLMEFDRVCENCSNLNPQPLTLLSALMRHEEEIYQLHKRLKLSNDELHLGLFIVKHRHDDFSNGAFEHCQDILCDTPGGATKVKEQLCELLKYTGQESELGRLTAYELPKMPVNGHTLMQMGVAKGKPLGRALDLCRRKFKESRFTLTEKELLEFIKDKK